MVSKWMVGVALLLAWPGITQAQELRCNQVFMNASEKHICASPELMDLDKQIGELGRRASMHQDSFKPDQRQFRKALKTCDGDEGCLTNSYQNRIAELQAYIGTLPPPTEEEVAKLTEAGEKADAKRYAQADTREEIAANLAQQEMSEQEGVPIAEEAPAVEPSPVDPFLAETAAAELAGQEVASDETVNQATTPEVPKGSSELGPGGITFIVMLILGALAWFKSWLNKAVRRCPKCKKWYAGKVIDSDREAYTDYETKTFEDVHRDRHNVVTGRTTKQRQVKVRVVNTTNHYQCIHCDHSWAWTSTSRSS